MIAQDPRTSSIVSGRLRRMTRTPDQIGFHALCVRSGTRHAGIEVSAARPHPGNVEEPDARIDRDSAFRMNLYWAPVVDGGRSDHSQSRATASESSGVCREPAAGDLSDERLNTLTARKLPRWGVAMNPRRSSQVPARKPGPSYGSVCFGSSSTYRTVPGPFSQKRVTALRPSIVRGRPAVA